MTVYPDGKGVLLFGGYNPDDETQKDIILELLSGSNSWTILNVTLHEARKSHTVIPIP